MSETQIIIPSLNFRDIKKLSIHLLSKIKPVFGEWWWYAIIHKNVQDHCHLEINAMVYKWNYFHSVPILFRIRNNYILYIDYHLISGNPYNSMKWSIYLISAFSYYSIQISNAALTSIYLNNNVLASIAKEK